MNHLKHLKQAAMVVVLAATPHGAGAYGAIMIADYFPTDVGLKWEYTGTFTSTLIGGTVPINATIETTANQSIHSINTTRFDRLTNLAGDPGNRQFFSVTSSGLNLHREEFNFFNNDFEQSDNPHNVIPAMTDAGQIHMASQTFQGQDLTSTWTGTSTLTVNIVGFEDVMTPAGTFNALKVVVNNVWSVSGFGFTENGTSINTVWLAKGIGRVRLDNEFEDFEDGTFEESGGFSLLLTPEPTSLVLLGLGGFVLVRRRSRYAQ